MEKFAKSNKEYYKKGGLPLHFQMVSWWTLVATSSEVGVEVSPPLVCYHGVLVHLLIQLNSVPLYT